MYNILVFPGWFPSKVNPLSAIFTKKHIDILSKFNNILVIYVEPDQKQKQGFKIERYENKDCNTVICYYKKSNFILFEKVINIFLRFKAYFLAINESNISFKSFDFLHIHVITFDTIIPFLIHLFSGIPYFISEHSTIYIRKPSVSLVELYYKKIIVSRSKGISTVSESLKKAMEDQGLNHENSKIIPNVVDPEIFKIGKRFNTESTRFLHVSRLDEKAKNTIGILKVFEELYKKYNNIELHIVGGFIGITSDAENYKQNLNCKSAISFHGVKLGIDIIPFYQNADYFVMFSNYETQAVVILEALMCGLPVIATKLPALNEYLHQGNSLQVEAKDEEDLYNKMETCINNDNSFWTKNKIADEITKKFDLALIEKGFSDLYEIGLNT